MGWLRCVCFVGCLFFYFVYLLVVCSWENLIACLLVGCCLICGFVLICLFGLFGVVGCLILVFLCFSYYKLLGWVCLVVDLIVGLFGFGFFCFEFEF